MEEKSFSGEMASVLEALKLEMVINQALIDILVEKNIMTHDELQTKIKEIKIKSGIVLSSEAGKFAS